MSLNARKSGVMAIKVDNRTKEPSFTTVLDIPVVKEYRYLGLVTSNKLTAVPV